MGRSAAWGTVKAGLLFLGMFFVIIAFAPWIFVVLGALAVPVFGPSALAVGGGAALLTCCLSPALLVIGVICIILGLFTSPPPPQLVFVQPPWVPPPPGR